MGKTYKDIHRANMKKFWDTKPENLIPFWKRTHSVEWILWWREHERMWSYHNKDTWRYVGMANRHNSDYGEFKDIRQCIRENIIDREVKKELQEYYDSKL